MNFLDEIYQTWLALDDWLGSQRQGGLSAAGMACQRMSELNSYAFFVLLFGQLEDYINQEYDQSVGPWMEAAFEHRVNVLFSQGSTQAELVMNYYYLRCDIAHGHAEGGQMREQLRVPEIYENIQVIMAY